MYKTILLVPALTLLVRGIRNRCSADAFVFKTRKVGRRRALCSLRSSIGGGGTDSPPPEGDSDSPWDDLFREESENLQRAREYMSENALPLDYDESSSLEEEEGSSSSLVPSRGFFQDGSVPSDEALAKNPYLQVVSKLSPSEMIARFTSSAHPRVQNAVRSTILSLIGGLPKMAFDTTTITTGQRLASLMFQLQMTGYMFKNAEYRLTLQQSLGEYGDVESLTSQKLLLSGESDKNEEVDALKGKVKGKIRVRCSPKEDENVSSSRTSSDDEEVAASRGAEMEVDAEAYMSELRSEVTQLRDELMLARKEKEEALRKDLLAYIRTLPEKELRNLTSTMSQDVLVAMKGLVNAVMSGIGEGQIGPETVTEQSGEALAQLCMWQLVVGYNLRTLEVREEMKKSLNSLPGGSSEREDEGGTGTGPGAFE